MTLHQPPFELPPSAHKAKAAAHRRPSELLPVPDGKDIVWFQSWYRERKGVDLPYEVARPMLTHLVQFFYLTRGHELYDHNQRVAKRRPVSNGDRAAADQQLPQA